MSEGGIFLTTEHLAPPGARGTLTFRPSRWDHPFQVQAEVVRAVLPPEAGPDRPSGLGLRFVDLDLKQERLLRKLVEGYRSASVTEAIRNAYREPGNTIQQELRKRSADQKVIFATSASGEELRALIRDGNSAVLARLIDNPRLQMSHVRMIMRDARLQVTTLRELAKQRRWFRDEEIRFLYCSHPAAPERDVLRLIGEMSVPRLQQLAMNPNLRHRVKVKVKDLLKKKGVTAPRAVS